jgi:hypothetical protein
MSRKLIFLNLLLLALAGWLGWLLRVRWLEGEAKDRAIFQQAARARAVLPPAPLTPQRPFMSTEYLDVAQRLLFSKDRNPNVVIDVPPPKPEPPMPALPFYYGEMTIGDPIVLLSTTSNGVQKSYHAGDKVGPFDLVSFDRDKITLAWNGKTVERKLAELAPKDAAPAQQAPVNMAPAQPSSPVKSLSAAPAEDTNPKIGIDVGGGAGLRACVKGDNSPAGTVIDGYRKVVASGLMGESCMWEKVK